MPGRIPQWEKRAEGKGVGKGGLHFGHRQGLAVDLNPCAFIYSEGPVRVNCIR